MNDLRKYLVQLPSRLDFRNERKIKRAIYKALYYAVTQEGKYIDLLFMKVIPSDELQGYSWPWPLSGDRVKEFYEYGSEEEYKHPSNQTCGRAVQPGETIYRCAECGYDDTCILCSFCFNREDHIGHNVTMYVSSSIGGICDCGDETAFVRKLNCKCTCEEDSSLDLPIDFRRAIEDTLRCILAYILDVTNFSINALPFIHRNINGNGGLSITSQHISDFSSLPTDVYQAEDVNSSHIWYLILWNDENHNYPEAETAIRAATGMSDQKAKRTANEINRNGRAILKESDNYESLLSSQKSAQADGLVATICTARDYLREIIVLHMFNWLRDIVSFKGNSSFRNSCKNILAEVLLEPGFTLSKEIPAEFLKSETLDVPKMCYRNGIPYNGEFLTFDSSKVKPGATLYDLKQPLQSIIYHDTNARLVNSRIQYLLSFEIRFVSPIRKKFVSSIIPVLLNDPNTKARFAEQYVDAYPMLISIMAFADREERVASLVDISVQLFTCPRTNRWILESDKFINIISPLCSLIENSSSRKNESGILNLIDLVVDIRSGREKSAIQTTIKICIEIINRIITKNDLEDILNLILTHTNLVLFASFLRYFQGLAPIVRKYGDHIERESLTEFYSFIQKAVPIMSIVDSAARVQHLDISKARRAIESLIPFLASRELEFKSPGIAKFKVSKEPISHFNPLNSFLSYLLQEVGIDAMKDYMSSCGSPFMRISDFSLRSVVLASQVKVGFWVRNGITVTRQTSYMMEAMADVSYFRDLHINQITTIFDDPKTTLMNFLDRWELLSWYMGEMEHDNTIYEHRFSFMCEQFISFLYSLFTNRQFFDRSRSKAQRDERTKRAICYALCEEPKSYSKLRKSLPIYATKSPNFDNLLKECANYQPPTGIYDFGIYRLKPEIYEILDPMGHLEGSTEVFEALYTNIAKSHSSNAKEVILTPKIIACESEFVNQNIGKIVKTTEFAKLSYKLLQVAIDTQDEEFLPHLLHLIHAIILDNDILGKKNLEEALVRIPVSNLLLTISESGMSASIVSKAEFLLDQFVSRDASIMDSLVDCFGESHIQSYKTRKDESFANKRQKSSKVAQDRKSKIMKKFAKQRQQFMMQNDMQEMEDVNSKGSSGQSFMRKCVACGETESVDDVFGIPSVSNQAPVFWKLPPEGYDYLDLAFSEYSDVINQKESETYGHGLSKNFRMAYPVTHSCAHPIHVSCNLQNRLLLMYSSPCPLCHNLHDDIVPLFQSQSPGQFLDQNFLYGPPSANSFNLLTESHDIQRNNAVMQNVIHQDYFDINGDLKEKFKDTVLSCIGFDADESTATNVCVTLHEIEKLIAHTISAQEMSLRIEGADTNPTFIKDIPSSFKTLIRSLLQTRVLFFETQVTKESNHLNSAHNSIDHSSVFSEVVSRFFSSNESLQTTIRMGLAKIFAITVVQLCTNYMNFLLSISIKNSPSVSDSEIQIISTFCNTISKHHDVNFNEKGRQFFSNLFLCVERCILPYLRQCAIFMDILICERINESDLKSNSIFEDLELRLEEKSYKYSTVPLCESLGVPQLMKLFSLSAFYDADFNFESQVIETFTTSSHFKALPKELQQIDYPNVPRLIELPIDFNSTITDPQNKAISDSICLSCGQYISRFQRMSHHVDCASRGAYVSNMGLYFSPNDNAIYSVVEMNKNPYELQIPGPYMTEHGEIKKVNSSGKASLNILRYRHLNKLWINQGLFGFVTRTMYGERMSPMDNNMDVPGVAFEEDSDEEFVPWE